MQNCWNTYIFDKLRQRLQDSVIKLVNLERNGEVIDSQLVIGVRKSYSEFLLVIIFSKNFFSLQNIR